MLELARSGEPFFYYLKNKKYFHCHCNGKPHTAFCRLYKDRTIKSKIMKWLTLTRIKQQLRIEADFTEEDDLLEMYGESAEDVLLNYLNRSYEDLMEVYGHVPAPLVHASLMLVDTSYQYRSPVSTQSMSVVPYTFDILVKPYMRLSSCNCND